MNRKKTIIAISAVCGVVLTAVLAVFIVKVFGNKERKVVIRNSEEMSEVKYEGGEQVVRRIMFGNALGYEKCYCELVSRGINGFKWNLYNEDREMMAMQFGFNDYEPYLYSVDMDGDGIDELISLCTYSGDGAVRIFVYRNNNGTIELGVFEPNLSVPSYSMEYDSAEKKIIMQNWTEETETVLGIDDFSFSRFDPENFP